MEKNNLKFKFTIILSILILISTFVISMSLGATKVSFIKAFNALTLGDFSSQDLRILLYVRLPRCLGSVLAGSALAVSGSLIQAVLNNPMASPNIIGVNSGAGFAVIAIVSFLPSKIYMIPFAAFLGAVFSCLLIYAIAMKSGAGRVTVTLVGIAVTGILNSGISTLKTFFPNTVYNISTFSVGGLGAVNGKILLYSYPIILICLILSFLLSRGIDILCLGEKTAFGLGVNVTVFRFILLLIASALAGSAVSFAGLIGFVGLVIPHITRFIVGTKHLRLIPTSALLGAEFVLLSDLLCRYLFKPYEIPVGILLSIVGGIFFIILILFKIKGNNYDKVR